MNEGNKNKLRTIEAQIVQKRKDNEPRPKSTGSYKKKACSLFFKKVITWQPKAELRT